MFQETQLLTDGDSTDNIYTTTKAYITILPVEKFLKMMNNVADDNVVYIDE